MGLIQFTIFWLAARSVEWSRRELNRTSRQGEPRRFLPCETAPQPKTFTNGSCQRRWAGASTFAEWISFIEQIQWAGPGQTSQRLGLKTGGRLGRDVGAKNSLHFNDSRLWSVSTPQFCSSRTLKFLGSTRGNGPRVRGCAQPCAASRGAFARDSPAICNIGCFLLRKAGEHSCDTRGVYWPRIDYTFPHPSILLGSGQGSSVIQNVSSVELMLGNLRQE